LLDVVKPLCEFAANLPDFARKTKSLSAKTQAIRAALMGAEEPATLLFEQLPKACGMRKIPTRKKPGEDVTQKYVRSLKKALNELRSAYPSLLQRIENSLAESFSLPQEEGDSRELLRGRSQSLAIHVSDASLKAFCLRLADAQLSPDAWLESVGSLVAAKPPRRWLDTDEQRFHESLEGLATRFKQTETVAFAKTSSSKKAVRISILTASGEEQSRVVELADKDQTAIRKGLQKQFEKNPAQAAAIAAELLLQHLPNLK
jgi:hypothetical protein